MASEAIKKMFLQQMFERQRANRAGKAFNEIAGSQAMEQETAPYQIPDEQMFPGEAPIQGLMSITQEEQPATGLFNYEDPKRFEKFAIDAAGSDNPALQKYGLSQLAGMGESGSPTAKDYLGARVFDVGVKGNPNIVQKSMLGPEGKLITLGDPRYPRNPYLDRGNDFYNAANPDEIINKTLGRAEFEKKQGVAEQKFLNEYSMNLDKTEASIESTDFMLEGLDELANTATGWSTGMGSLLKSLPTSDAATWKALQTSVLSGLGIDKISELKSQSSTGATGFGALNEQELELLVSYRGKLEQATNPKDIKKVIGKMQRLIRNSRSRMVKNIAGAQKRFEKLTGKHNYDTAGIRDTPENLDVKVKSWNDLP